MAEEDRYTRITLRIPKELHGRLDAEAERTSKSLNAEIVARLQASFEGLVDARALSQLETQQRLTHLIGYSLMELTTRKGLGWPDETLRTHLRNLAIALHNRDFDGAATQMSEAAFSPKPPAKKKR